MESQKVAIAVSARHAKKQYWKHQRWHPPQKTDWPWMVFVGVGILLILLMLCCGCATQPAQHGISNFGVVSDKDAIYRGGEPGFDAAVWLSKAGVSNYVKLNTISEGKDWRDHGTEVRYFPITTAQQLFGTGLNDTIPKAVAAITPGTYIHCSHGKNRTGTVVGVYRLTHDGWSTKAVQAEMTRYGWDDSLPGLRWYFSCVARQP